MKTVLTLATVVVATSFAVSHVAVAQDRTKGFQTAEASLVETIGRHFQRCWFPPEGLDGQQSLIVVRFELFPDGSLRAQPTIVERTDTGSREFRAAAEAAQRAVLECTPLKGLPRASYEQWREIELVFGPRPLSLAPAKVVPPKDVRVSSLRRRDPNDGYEVDAVGGIDSGSNTPDNPSGGDGGSPSAGSPDADSPDADSPTAESPDADSPNGDPPSNGGGLNNFSEHSTTTDDAGNVTMSSSTEMTSSGGGSSSNVSVNFNLP